MKSEIFEKIKKLNLPHGKYVIFGSGPMGIRGLRKCHDVDVIVSKDIWDQYSHNPDWKIKIIANGEKILVDETESIELGISWGPGIWNINELIHNAEIIDGLAFANMDDVLKWKKIFGREKDLEDIKIIGDYLKNKK